MKRQNKGRVLEARILYGTREQPVSRVSDRLWDAIMFCGGGLLNVIIVIPHVFCYGRLVFFSHDTLSLRHLRLRFEYYALRRFTL